MDWVHCNSCLAKPRQVDKHKHNQQLSFTLNSCGHLLCSGCLSQAHADLSGGQQCIVCSYPCSTIPLTSNLKPDVAMYFTELRDHLQRSHKQAAKIAAFQTMHWRRLVERRSRNVATLESECKALQAQLNDQIETNLQLEEEIRDMTNIMDSSPYAKAITMSTPEYNMQMQQQSPLLTIDELRPARFAMLPQTPPHSIHSNDSPSPMSIGSGMSSSNYHRRLSIRGPPFGGRTGVVHGSAGSQYFTPSPSMMHTDVTPTPASRGRLRTPSSYSGFSECESIVALSLSQRNSGQQQPGSDRSLPMSLYIHGSRHAADNDELMGRRPSQLENPFTSKERLKTVAFPLKSCLKNYISKH